MAECLHHGWRLSAAVGGTELTGLIKNRERSGPKAFPPKFSTSLLCLLCTLLSCVTLVLVCILWWSLESYGNVEEVHWPRRIWSQQLHPAGFLSTLSRAAGMFMWFSLSLGFDLRTTCSYIFYIRTSLHRSPFVCLFEVQVPRSGSGRFPGRTMHVLVDKGPIVKRPESFLCWGISVFACRLYASLLCISWEIPSMCKPANVKNSKYKRGNLP